MTAQIELVSARFLEEEAVRAGAVGELPQLDPPDMTTVIAIAKTPMCRSRWCDIDR